MNFKQLNGGIFLKRSPGLGRLMRAIHHGKHEMDGMSYQKYKPNYGPKLQKFT